MNHVNFHNTKDGGQLNIRIMGLTLIQFLVLQTLYFMSISSGSGSRFSPDVKYRGTDVFKSIVVLEIHSRAAAETATLLNVLHYKEQSSIHFENALGDGVDA